MKFLFYKLIILVFIITSHYSGYGAKYYITGTNYTRYDGTVQAGSNDNILLYLRVSVSSVNGGNVPVTINSITFEHLNTSQLSDIGSVTLWYSGNSLFFTSASPVQTISPPIFNSIIFNNLNFNINSSGSHYFWYTCSVGASAKAGNQIYGGIPANGLNASDYLGSQLWSPSNFSLSNHLDVICPSVNYVPPNTPALTAMNQFTKPTIAGGANYNSLLLKPDGTVWVAGYNNNGQFGDGTVGNYYTNNLWQQVTDSEIYNMVQIDVGWETNVALRSDGTVWAWGDNWWGKVGNGVVSSNEPTPQQVLKQNGLPLTNVVKVMCGMVMSAALTSDHKVYAWGRNSGGAFGLAYTSNIAYPYAQLLYDGTNPINWAIDMEVGESSITLLRYDGTVWAMGSNIWSTLGNGNNISSLNPVSAINTSAYCGTQLTNITSISSDHRATLALDATGNVYGWGWNNYAQCGNNNPGVIQMFPTPTLGTNCTGTLTNIVQIKQTHNNGFAVDANNNLYSWGSDQSGQLGNGGAPIGSNVYCPVYITNNAVEVNAGLSNMFYWNTNGELCAAGFNWYGQLGIGGPYGCCGYEHVPVCMSFGPLPVELLAFKGEAQGMDNYLDWITASELYNDYFLIEYSLDGNNFHALEEIKGAGHSNHDLYYSFLHKNVPADIMYYRLKQVDYNGNYEYSKVIQVKNPIINKHNIVWVITTEEYVEIHSLGYNQSVPIFIEILNTLGSRIFQNSFIAHDEKSFIRVPKSIFSTGIYLLNMKSSSYQKSQIKFSIP